MSFPKIKFKSDKKDKEISRVNKTSVSIQDKGKDVTTIQPKKVESVANKPSIPISSVEGGIKFEPIVSKTFYKPLVDKKLTILLVENTSKVVEERERIINIIQKVVSPGLISIIEYGSVVEKSEIFNISDFNNIPFLCNNNIEGKTCLYDAIPSLHSLVLEQYMHIEEKEKERVRINDIEIIGIGTCTDLDSEVWKEVAISMFSEIVSKPRVTTKYFCLTEESFFSAAEIGFRSIGAIFRKYQ